MANENTTVVTYEWDEPELEVPSGEDAYFADNYFPTLRTDNDSNPDAITNVPGKLQFHMDFADPVIEDPQESVYNYRCELAETRGVDIILPGDEVWYGWSYEFGSNWIFSNGNIDDEIAISIHQGISGPVGPVFVINKLREGQFSGKPAGTLSLHVKVESEYHHLDGYVPGPDDEYTFVVKYVCGYGSAGYLTLWINDNLVYDGNHSTLYNTDSGEGGPRFKFGQYATGYADTWRAEEAIAEGLGVFDTYLGTVRYVHRTSSHPDFGDDAYDIVKSQSSPPDPTFRYRIRSGNRIGGLGFLGKAVIN